MQGLRRLAQSVAEGQRSASTIGRAAEAVKSQVASAAAKVSETVKPATEAVKGQVANATSKVSAAAKPIVVEGKHGKGYIQFLEDITQRDTVVGAMTKYARAVIDGNLAEVAIYGGSGPGATFKGTDSAGNRYYERLDAYNCRSRMVVYADIASGRIQGYEASTVQGDGWYSWLHYTTDLTPEQRDIMVPVYAKPREVTWMGQPKVAEGRFFPKGSWYQGNKRRNWVKLSPWRPPGPQGERVQKAETRATTKDFAGT